MDIRTKLVFALVSVALGSMLMLGVMMYGGVQRELREQTMEQLEGFAEFKVDALEGILSGWHDRVALVASGTQLRRALAEHGRTGGRAAAEEVTRILEDALEASPLFRDLWVHAPDGTPVAHAGPDGVGAPPEFDVPAEDAGDATRYGGVAFASEGAPTVSFTARLTLDGDAVGYLHAVLGTEEILDLSTNYEGLGDTGETMVVVRDGTVGARVLHPVRFAGGDPGAEPAADAAADRPRDAGLLLDRDGAAVVSLDGAEASFAGGVTDYRGEQVWAVTRFLPETGWGVVVKIDEDEQVQPIVDFRADTTRLAVTLAAFAILIGTLIGFRVAQPVLALSEMAGRIRGGDLAARSGVSREDEVGLLARTFDEMAGSLQEKVELLTQFRTFFDVSLDMMCIAATDGYFKRINHAFVRELGWSESELLERSFVSFVHAEDVEATLREIEKLVAGEPTIHFENRFLCADGTYKLLRWTSYPEEHTGRLYAIARVAGAQPPEAL